MSRYVSSFSLPTTHIAVASVKPDGGPRPRKRRGRPRKWQPRAISAEDVQAGATLVRKYSDPESIASRRQRRDDFSSFCGYNRHISSAIQLLTGLLGQMSRSGLTPSTIAEYWHIMMPGLKHGRVPPVVNASGAAQDELSELHKVVELFNADCPGGHAVDATVGTLKKVIKETKFLFLTAKKETRLACTGAAATLEMMLKTGLRAVDIARLWFPSLKIGEKEIHITLRWTKGIRKRVQQRPLNLPMWFGKISRKTIKRSKIFVKKLHPKRVSVKLNRMLKKTKFHAFSTYSFRRKFMHRSLEECNGDAAEAARRFTGHANPAMLLAHYYPDTGPLRGGR